MLPWKGGEFKPELSLALSLSPVSFLVFAGFDGFTRLDRISPLLVNNSDLSKGCLKEV